METSELKIFRIPDWFDQINTAKSVLPLAKWNGAVRHYLEPIEDGALLCWTFSNPAAPTTSQLFVRLTESEAQLVSETDLRTTGMLENIRRSLVHTEALVFSYSNTHDDSYGVVPFVIKRDSSEEGFSLALDHAGTFAVEWWASMKAQTEEWLAHHGEPSSDHATSSDPHLCEFHQAEARLREVETFPKRLKMPA